MTAPRPTPPTCVPPPILDRHPRRGVVLRATVTVYDPRHDRRWTIPAGYHHDGVSAPRLTRWWIDNDDLSDDGGVVHDYLYDRQGDVGDGRRPYTRAEADTLFDDFNARDDVRPDARRTARATLRWTGWWAWWRAGRRAAARPADATDGARVQHILEETTP